MMKKLIRKSVFETNSSSTHSISLGGDDKQFILDTIYPDQDGKVYVRGGEFGWEWRSYNDAQTKLDYAYESDVDIERLRRVVMEQTGATEVVFESKDGYVNHGGYGTAHDACKSDESTKDFIFNKNSWLFTGNDNSIASPTFYDVPEYKDGRVINPTYKYELIIDGFDKTTKFKHKPTDTEIEDGIDSLMDGVLMFEQGGFITNQTIEFQITRSRDFFEKSWMVRQDYTTGHILMVKEGNYENQIETKLKDDGKLEGLNWDEKSKLVREVLLTRPDIAKQVKFTLKEI